MLSEAAGGRGLMWRMGVLGERLAPRAVAGVLVTVAGIAVLQL